MACKELDLHVKPQKSISYVFGGKFVEKRSPFISALGKPPTSQQSQPNILERCLAILYKLPERELLISYTRNYYQALNSSTPQTSEVSTWCGAYNTSYYLPLINFHLAANTIPDTHIVKMQHTVTRYLCMWLSLPQCITTAALFHLHSLNVKHLSDLRKEAQCSFLATVMQSNNPFVRELHPLLQDEFFQQTLHLAVR